MQTWTLRRARRRRKSEGYPVRSPNKLVSNQVRSLTFVTIPFLLQIAGPLMTLLLPLNCLLVAIRDYRGPYRFSGNEKFHPTGRTRSVVDGLLRENLPGVNE